VRAGDGAASAGARAAASCATYHQLRMSCTTQHGPTHPGLFPAPAAPQILLFLLETGAAIISITTEVVPELRNQLAIWTAEVQAILQQEAAAWAMQLQSARATASAAATAADAWAAAGGVPAGSAAAVGAAAAAWFEGGAAGAGGAATAPEGEFDCWNGGGSSGSGACSSIDEIASGGGSSEEWEAERRRQHKARHRWRQQQQAQALGEAAWQRVGELQEAVSGLRRSVEGGLAYVQRQYEKRQEQVRRCEGGGRALAGGQ
jgi:hypothetical protein